jgi:hypothetical protein
MTPGAINGAPSLIDLDRNEFAPFPFGHELVYVEGRPTGYLTTADRTTQTLDLLEWQKIPFNASVRTFYRRRAVR